MSTKAPSPVKEFQDTSLEKQVYSLVESFKEFIPAENDRYRLGYGLFQYISGEGDAPEVLVKSTKIQVKKISLTELAGKISEELSKIK